MQTVAAVPSVSKDGEKPRGKTVKKNGHKSRDSSSDDSDSSSSGSSSSDDSSSSSGSSSDSSSSSGSSDSSSSSSSGDDSSSSSDDSSSSSSSSSNDSKIQRKQKDKRTPIEESTEPRKRSQKPHSVKQTSGAPLMLEPRKKVRPHGTNSQKRSEPVAKPPLKAPTKKATTAKPKVIVDSNGKKKTPKKKPQSSSSSQAESAAQKKHHHDHKTKHSKGKKSTKQKQPPPPVDNEDDDDEDQDMSIMQMARLGYQELVNAIIRPPRAAYEMEALGPAIFEFEGRRYCRNDFTLKTPKRGHKLQCSRWARASRDQTAKSCDHVVIYMHGNSSARTEVVPQCLALLLSLGVSVVAFDFAGSGKSDGQYVSLGFYEREDLSCVIDHLRSEMAVSNVALWGRSMGAATALMYGDRDPLIAGMILDSPFSDLTQLFNEMLENARKQGMAVPGLIASVALRMLRGSVKKQAGFNMKEVTPISHAKKCMFPALIVTGEKDDFILPHHAKDIFDQYGGSKKLLVVPGTHSTPRPRSMFESATHFLIQSFGMTGMDDGKSNIPTNVAIMCPPWLSPKDMLSAQNPKRNPNQPASTCTEISNSNSVYDQEQDIGMTADRQRDIQTSLFKMLGQDDGNDRSSANEKLEI